MLYYRTYVRHNQYIIFGKLHCTVRCSVIKRITNLPECIHGFYYCDGEYYIILINSNIKDNERLYRCVLAEELGHHMMTIGDMTPRKFMCYRDRLYLDKQERMAMKWATDFLLPTDKVLEAFRRNLADSIPEMAELFCVTEEFFLHKMDFMSKRNSIWPLDGNRSLYLYDFPSVWVYEKI